jgi:hypothetical protein
MSFVVDRYAVGALNPSELPALNPIDRLQIEIDGKQMDLEPTTRPGKRHVSLEWAQLQ